MDRLAADWFLFLVPSVTSCFQVTRGGFSWLFGVVQSYRLSCVGLSCVRVNAVGWPKHDQCQLPAASQLPTQVWIRHLCCKQCRIEFLIQLLIRCWQGRRFPPELGRVYSHSCLSLPFLTFPPFLSSISLSPILPPLIPLSSPQFS